MRAGHERRGGRRPWTSRRRRRFHLASADANNDGNITREEFLARPTQMFDRLDANHDGVISTAERPQRSADGNGVNAPIAASVASRLNPDANGDRHDLARRVRRDGRARCSIGSTPTMTGV